MLWFMYSRYHRGIVHNLLERYAHEFVVVFRPGSWFRSRSRISKRACAVTTRQKAKETVREKERKTNAETNGRPAVGRAVDEDGPAAQQ
jgi:hypothetical protein